MSGRPRPPRHSKLSVADTISPMREMDALALDGYKMALRRWNRLYAAKVTRGVE